MSNKRLIYGFHAVNARLWQNPKSLLELYVQEGKSDARTREVLEQAAKCNVRVHFADAERMAEYVRAQGEGRFVVVGFSLGSGLAARTAQQYRADSLLLAAPYEGLAVLQQEKAPFVPPFLIKYRIPSAEFLRAVAHT